MALLSATPARSRGFLMVNDELLDARFCGNNGHVL
jgi:hypothetical protein